MDKNLDLTGSLMNSTTWQEDTEPTVNASAAWPTDSEQPLGTVQIIIAVVSSLICFVTVLGNLLVLGAFCSDRRLRTYTTYYIVGLSVADLVAGLITMPLYTVYVVLARWPFGSAVCDAYLYLNHVFIHTSVLGILVIAADRYEAVYHPLKHLRKRTVRHATFMISISYIVPFLLWLPWCLLWPYIVGARRIKPGLCYPQYTESLIFSILSPLVAFWIPTSATSVLYWRIYRVIRTSKKQGPVRMTDLHKSKRQDPVMTSISNHAQEQGLVRMTDLRKSKQQDPVMTSISNHALAARVSIPTAKGQQPSKNLADPGSDAAPILLSSAASTHATTELHSSHENPGFEADLHHNNNVTSQITDTVDVSDSLSVKTMSSSSNIDASSANPTINQAADGTIGSSTKPSKRERYSSTRESHRATRTLTLILVVLLVSSVPWSVLVIISCLCPNCIPLILYQASVYLAHMNSTVNPFCYAVTNPLYRGAFRRLFSCFRRTTAPTRTGRSSSRPCTISTQQNTLL